MFDGIQSRLKAHLQRFGVKLMLLYLGLLLVPLVGIGLFGNFYIQRSVTKYKQQSFSDAVTMQARHIDQIIAHAQDDLIYLEQTLQHTSPNQGLGQFSTAHALYQQLVLVEADGVVSAGFAGPTLTNWLASNANLLDALPMRRPYFSVVEGGDEAAILVATRITGGVLVMTLDAEQVLGPTSSPAVGAWALLFPAGTSLVTGELPASLPTLAGNQGQQAYGSDAYFYQRVGPGGTWLLLHRVPESTIQANLSDYYTTFLILLVGSMVSVVGLALFAIARITEPIYQLQAMFEQVRRENTPPPLPNPLPSDEFGGLMADFVQLATELNEKRQAERDLIEQLITAQEEERKLIAYDLHDGLIQHLVGARFYLRKCQSCEVPMQGDANEVRRGYDVLTEAITEGRRIIQGLHPTALDDLGLTAALTDLTEMMAQTAGWESTCDIDPLPNDLNRVASVTLYRIAQEALNNAFKHACAKHVQVSLHCQEDALVLTVTDDGVGFTAPAFNTGNKRNGWGIRTMHERAHMLNGHCALETQPLAGTTVRAKIPCHKIRMEVHQ